MFMVKGRDFVVFSDTLGELPTSAYHLFKYVAEENRVFWFNTLCRPPKLTRMDLTKVRRALWSWLSGTGKGRPPSKNHPDIRVISPVMVPLFDPIFRRINCSLLRRRFRKIENQFGVRDPIFLTTFPVTADLFHCFPGCTRLYYCVDDFLNYPGVQHRRWGEMESDLLQSVDGLVVTSKYLARKGPTGLPLLHLPHGVDFDHFQSTTPTPPILAGLRRPVVGFFGLVSEWVDLDLLGYLADCFPEATFVIIGRSEVNLDRVTGKHNVKVLDHVAYADLPRFASWFDLGLIPFKINELTKAVNPLKLLEYYALGLPVVATRLPELEGFPGPIRLAETREEFRASLADLLKDGTPQRSAEAPRVASANSWRSRVNDLYRFIQDVEARRTASVV
jgi:glycosyltransferase involved in cell wall biosynthesis